MTQDEFKDLQITVVVSGPVLRDTLLRLRELAKESHDWGIIRRTVHLYDAFTEQIAPEVREFVTNPTQK